MSSEREENKNEKVIHFLAKNRFILLSIMGIGFIGIVLFGIFDSVSKNRNESAFLQINSIAQKWEQAQSDEDTISTVSSDALADLKEIVAKNSGFPATKANLLIADISFHNKDWSVAQVAYEAAYHASPKAYTAPMCLYNAAVCAEEQSNSDKAQELYLLCSEFKDFPLVSKVIFSCARIAEQKGLTDDAVTLYEELCSSYSSSVWANLAKSRLIALKIVK